MKPQGIFISYRREHNAAHAGRLYDRLSDAFGEQAVFMDVDSIGLGLDFARVLDEAVASCSVMLVLVGPGWAQLADQRGRRLDDPSDYVRQEVETGLRREIRVVPVLVRGAALPVPEELPEGLRPLARRQAFPLPDEAFRSQAQVLVERLRPLVSPGAVAAPWGAEPAWTAELVNTSARQRVLRVRLTRAQHLVTYTAQLTGATLQVDEAVVVRRALPSGKEKGRQYFELPFQLPDGGSSRPCTFTAYSRKSVVLQIARAVLTVDGQVLYDEGRPRASLA
jgi:hypothetical protein